MIRLRCHCGNKYKEMSFKFLKHYGFKKRTNYPYGRKSKGITTIFCNCGRILIAEVNNK